MTLIELLENSYAKTTYIKNNGRIWDEYIRPKKTYEEILTINKQPTSITITGLLIGDKEPVTFTIKIVQTY